MWQGEKMRPTRRISLMFPVLLWWWWLTSSTPALPTSLHSFPLPSSITCRLTPASDQMASSSSPPSDSKEKKSSFFPQLWPLPLWLVIAAIPFLPSYCFINRGYTQWFHWCAFAFLLTQNKVLCKFIAIQGLLINVGWYCTLLTDYFCNDRLLHILYRNMPELLGQFIIDPSYGNITGQNVVLLPNTPSCVLSQVIAFSLDLVLHPLLCYYFWRRNDSKWHRICTWKILGFALVLSRIWSLTHNWWHYEEIGFYYFGTEVYKVAPASEPLWMAAYVGEAVTTTVLVTGKLWLAWKARKEQVDNRSKKHSAWLLSRIAGSPTFRGKWNDYKYYPLYYLIAVSIVALVPLPCPPT